MDLCDFLSKKENYERLVKKTKEMIRNYDPEEVNDIVSQALLLVLDYYERKPGKLLEIEKKEPDAMFNTLKVAARNHTLNILKKKNKQRIKETEWLTQAYREEVENIRVFKRSWHTNVGVFRKLKEKLGFTSVNLDEFTLEKVKKDIYFFLGEKIR